MKKKSRVLFEVFFCCTLLFVVAVVLRLYQDVSCRQFDLNCSSGFDFWKNTVLGCSIQCPLLWAVPDVSDCFGFFCVASIL